MSKHKAQASGSHARTAGNSRHVSVTQKGADEGRPRPRHRSPVPGVPMRGGGRGQWRASPTAVRRSQAHPAANTLKEKSNWKPISLNSCSPVFHSGPGSRLFRDYLIMAAGSASHINNPAPSPPALQPVLTAITRIFHNASESAWTFGGFVRSVRRYSSPKEPRRGPERAASPLISEPYRTPHPFPGWPQLTLVAFALNHSLDAKSQPERERSRGDRLGWLPGR